eukprot:scaffold169818_cov31-Tisochrysis_lutea.AAC.2
MAEPASVDKRNSHIRLEYNQLRARPAQTRTHGQGCRTEIRDWPIQVGLGAKRAFQEVGDVGLISLDTRVGDGHAAVPTVQPPLGLVPVLALNDHLAAWRGLELESCLASREHMSAVGAPSGERGEGELRPEDTDRLAAAQAEAYVQLLRLHTVLLTLEGVSGALGHGGVRRGAARAAKFIQSLTTNP